MRANWLDSEPMTIQGLAEAISKVVPSKKAAEALKVPPPKPRAALKSKPPAGARVTKPQEPKEPLEAKKVAAFAKRPDVSSLHETQLTELTRFDPGHGCRRA